MPITQTKKIAETFNDILGVKFTSVQIANIADGTQQADVPILTNVTSTLTVVDAFVSLVKKVPGISGTIAIADIVANAEAVRAEYSKDNGIVSESSLVALASSLTGGITAVATLATTVTISPLIVTLGLVASAGLGIYALTQPEGSYDVDAWLGETANSLQEFALQLDTLPTTIIDSLGSSVLPNLISISQSLRDFTDFTIPESLVDQFAQIRLIRMRSDPLVLDLDGDCIETVGTDAGVLFDHSADGLKQGTGWVAADDGLLVLDINGDGTIDSGRELFGDNTLLADGTTAEQGFAALKDHDSNNDGVINTDDDIYSQLQVWQDVNQDGISQINELKTLTEFGITSIHVDETENVNINQNGNQISITSSFTCNGEEYEVGQVNYSVDTFHSEFSDSIEISEQAQSLPDMAGSGGLRDLREAATLNSDLATEELAWAA